MFAPPFHHGPPALKVIASVLSAPHFVPVDMCQRNFYELTVPAFFAEDRASYGAQAVTDEPVLEPYSF